MKAIRVHEFGGPEVLKLEEVATPKPSAGPTCALVRMPCNRRFHIRPDRMPLESLKQLVTASKR
jgi:hypothetical protein